MRGSTPGLVRVLLLCFPLLLSPAAGAAQATHPHPLEPGNRVSVTAERLLEPTVVIVDALAGDTLLATSVPWDVPLRIPVLEIERLEEPRRDRLKPALIGAAVGALAATAFMAYDQDWNADRGGRDPIPGSLREEFLSSATTGVPLGGAAGALIGALLGLQGWERVPVSPHAR